MKAAASNHVDDVGQISQLDCPSAKKKKSGGFQAMGLSYNVLKGVLKRGYKIPTPIQRKCIPIILEGRDIVAMARTGSGKTASFLIPMFELLSNTKMTASSGGARGLILSPTRELALQTYKFIKELAKFTTLRTVLILGGDSMDEQFSSIHENPDVIVATPGRFLHVIMEMNMKLNSVQYVVFDEADRLFEMGFADQLREMLNRLPDARQTLLFSATLPKLLVDFAQAGLTDPVLVRLDVDSKLSENLKMLFVNCHSNEKTAILVHLLQNVIPDSEQTLVFASTKHHVEYLTMVLEMRGVSCTCVYSDLDPLARKINVAKFQNKKASVMVVTDVAARGVDIPLLDNVINYNFPAKPKLMVHRVGRVARAGRLGRAISLVSPDELPYLLDMYLFLGRSLVVADDKTTMHTNGVIGSVPAAVIDSELENLNCWHNDQIDAANMFRVCGNATKQYLKSRPGASVESVKRAKEMLETTKFGMLPLLTVKGTVDQSAKAKQSLIDEIKNYRPQTTIFEVSNTAKNASALVMRKKRKRHEKAILDNQEKLKIKLSEAQPRVGEGAQPAPKFETPLATADDVENTFKVIVGGGKKKSGKAYVPGGKKRKQEGEGFQDKNFYIPYKSADHYTEKGLDMEKIFRTQAKDAVMDLTSDDRQTLHKDSNSKKWDRKKKKFVQADKPKKIKTESGTWVPASYKTNRYEEWVKKNRIENQDNDSDTEGKAKNQGRFRGRFKHRMTQKVAGTERVAQKGAKKGKGPRRELRNPEQILKERGRKEKLQANEKRRQMERSKRKFKNANRRK